MDYTVSLASVDAAAIAACRSDRGAPLAASLVVRCPHDIVNVDVQPLGAVLAELLDVGQPLRNDGWHPLRAPIAIDPETAMARTRRLREAWQAAEPELGGLMGDVVGADIRAVLDLYVHAGATNEWVVSFLSAPADPALAERSLVPETVAAPVTG
jgi:hypothetical protein